MSTIKVNSISDAAGANGNAITLATDGTCTAKITSINNGQIANRNVLINGAMQINQRGDAAATGSAGYLSADRWKTHNGSGAQVAVSRSTDAPDGFAYSTKWDCTTADTSVAASDYLVIGQDLEGQDVQRFHKGKSTAKKFALQFWIKSTITGTYIVNLLDSDNSRQIAKAYTISSSNTWEKKTMVFDADTTGAFTVDANKSLRVSFYLIAGSDYTSGTLSTTWATETSANKAVGQVNAVSSTSNDVFITGVQLEVDTCTDFEHRSYGDELARCQRYYEQVYGGYKGRIEGDSDHDYDFAIMYKATKRADPTLTLLSSEENIFSSVTVTNASLSSRKESCLLRGNNVVGGGGNLKYVFGRIAVDAEL